MIPSREKFPIVIHVGSISDNSGVYLGHQNVILGISRHSKSNNGFGSIGSNNIASRNLNIVDDRDLVDTPIDDRDVKILQTSPASSASSPTQISFETINVLTMSQNSGVFVGDVKITGQDSHTKQNSAQGSTLGDGNVEMQNLNLLFDSDVIDTPIQDQDFKVLSR
ncbi:hypothetical protein [Alicyclobacillus acidiphilus]|uniref:hypothetical protein n=1 Tax=Alicyclobacillus acidiphilus TaxID=182455 RepID=UPI00082B23BF|nr:hypothetical protein [Alicyclobacillus acidiphilus]